MAAEVEVGTADWHDDIGLDMLKQRLSSMGKLAEEVRCISSPRGAHGGKPRPSARARRTAAALIKTDRLQKLGQQMLFSAEGAPAAIDDAVAEPMNVARRRIFARIDDVEARVEARTRAAWGLPEPEPEPEPEPPRVASPREVELLDINDVGRGDIEELKAAMSPRDGGGAPSAAGLFGAITVMMAAKKWIKFHQATAPRRTLWVGVK